MKYFLMASITISLVVLFGTSTANGLWIPRSEQDLLENSQTIFVGNITGVKVITLEKSLTYGTEENGVPRTVVENYTLNVDQYAVDVEEFLKNPQNFDSATVRQPAIPAGPGYLGTIGGFKIGDRVLFYLDKIDGKNTYSPESFLIPKPCMGKDVITQARLEFGGDFIITQNDVKVDYDSIAVNKPVLFTYDKDMRTLSGKSFDLMVEISKNNGKNTTAILSREIHTGSKLCEWMASAQWGFTPTEGSYNMDVATRENGTITEQSHISFSVKTDANNKQLSPTQQFQKSHDMSAIQCENNYKLVIKSSNGNPACVRSETKAKLMTSGWAKPLSNLDQKMLEQMLDSAHYFTSEEGEFMKNVALLDNQVKQFVGKLDSWDYECCSYYTSTDPSNSKPAMLIVDKESDDRLNVLFDLHRVKVVSVEQFSDTHN